MKTLFKYEEILNSVEKSINQGILESGKKLPSVRALCAELGVSPSTVFKAYYELEAKGLIEARSKSGYYVSLNTTQLKRIKQKNEQIVLAKSISRKAKNVDEMIDEMELSKQGDIDIDFSSATPSVQMLPIEKLHKSIRSSLLINKQNLIGYENPLGAIELRKHILLQTIKENFSDSIDDVIITAGCLEAIGICLKILVKNGDHILVDSSNYYNILSLLKSINVTIYTYPFSETSNFDFVAFKKTLKEKKITLCIISSNFHNPTGLSLDDSIKKEIITITTENNIHIIEDDVYRDLYFGKNKPSTLKQFDTHNMVYYCSSFSKTLAPGFRIGYCLPGNQSQEFAKYKRLQSLGTNSVTQAAIVNFMATGRYDLHLKKLRKQLHINMLKYGDAILKYFPEEIDFIIPEGGYVLWIGFPNVFDGYDLYKKLIKEKILITPGEIFSTDGSYKNFIRISYSEPFNEKINYALQKIGEHAFLLMKN